MKITYEDIVDYYKLDNVYHNICCNTKHREKIVSFELSKFSNLMDIYNRLKYDNYCHGRYNVFLIKKPKSRVIMSERMDDKIVNHLVSTYVLFPLLEPKLIDANVATRVNMGLDKGIFFVKKYLNLIRNNIDNYYILKCDITKFFYNIDHKVLLEKLEKIINDERVFNLIKTIIDSTNYDYVNNNVSKVINREIKHLEGDICNSKIIDDLRKIPLYQKGKGLPIGNMSSQILAIFYLNDLDHFIKEKLRIKYYVRYMDDFLLIHEDKKYLEYCKIKIKEELAKMRLKLNKKTIIFKINQSFVFLGYRFITKNNRIYLLPCKSMHCKIRKRYKKDGDIILDRYNGYLKRCSNYKNQNISFNNKC